MAISLHLESQDGKAYLTSLISIAHRLVPKLLREGEFQTEKDTGLKFAAVVADYNPIHLYKWSARLFGFKQAIAHGMYVVAKVFHQALEVWDKEHGAYPVEIDLKFIKPVFLSSRVAFYVYRIDDKKSGKPKLIVLVRNPNKEDEIHLQGTLTYAKA